jgi:two-component system, OmpR family, heavy metal sensor histidine kinase CusS
MKSAMPMAAKVAKAAGLFAWVRRRAARLRGAALPEAPSVRTAAPSCDHYSISARLSRSLAIQTALGLGVLCLLIFAAAYWLIDRKLQEEWVIKATVVREILVNTAAKGDVGAHAQMSYYEQRRPGSHVVIRRADGSLWYSDQHTSFDPDHRSTRRGQFKVDAPSWAGGSLWVDLTIDCRSDMRLLSALALTLLLASLGGGAFVGMAAAWRVRRELAPVHDLAAQTRAIDAQALGRRLSLSRPIAELQPAVDQFNALMQRLERAYVQLEAFNADVAHELRTPLAAMMGHTELALSRDRPAADLRDTLCGNLEELQRLTGLVNDMLFLAQADRGATARRGQPVSLARLASQVVEFHEGALEDGALRVHIEGDATVAVDEPLVKRALSNLIGNATRYAQPGTALAVRIAAQTGQHVRVEVDNIGPDIAPDHLPRIFDRFFRADAARSSDLRHHGLGLAIVAAIARMHAGWPLARSSNGRTLVGFTVAVAS